MQKKKKKKNPFDQIREASGKAQPYLPHVTPRVPRSVYAKFHADWSKTISQKSRTDTEILFNHRIKLEVGEWNFKEINQCLICYIFDCKAKTIPTVLRSQNILDDTYRYQYHLDIYFIHFYYFFNVCFYYFFNVCMFHFYITSFTTIPLFQGPSLELLN